MFSNCLLILTVAVCLSLVSGFCAVSPTKQQSTRLYETSIDGSTINNKNNNIETSTLTDTAATLKKDLLQLAASYDRGYGATKRANDMVDDLIQQLEALNTELDASRGVEGDTTDSPLKGSWRMVWTTASDVLTLSANPLIKVGAIYQVFDLPTVTNVIDLLPPFQTLVGNLDSVLRAKVTTRAYRQTNQTGNSNKIGLEFQKVALEPVQLLGNDVGFLPPLGFDLPKTPFEGYFDVSYVDDELLIIRQNAPGGLFVLAKVNNFDP